MDKCIAGIDTGSVRPNQEHCPRSSSDTLDARRGVRLFPLRIPNSALRAIRVEVGADGAAPSILTTFPAWNSTTIICVIPQICG
ncbi:MAG: hypothetical protein D4R65_15230 [Verrucomicrobiaceae bacterium]|nr:MAG: hypothetical protein D4R65_15230 [Verrucomicrobiaceae bacterium]